MVGQSLFDQSGSGAVTTASMVILPSLSATMMMAIAISVRMTNKTAFLALTVSLGVPHPNSARIRTLRLKPATWIRCHCHNRLPMPIADSGVYGDNPGRGIERRK